MQTSPLRRDGAPTTADLTSSRSLALIAACAAALLLTACPDDPVEPGPSEASWTVVAQDLDEALLSVHGTASDDVWAVGADRGDGALVLHWDGTSWTRVDTGHRGDLWWVHALADGTVFMAGADATILRWDDGVVERMAVPGVARYTVFGLWARRADEAWAVGAINGRDGFIWHWDGETWSEELVPALPLSSFGTAPALFKVWGDDESVYAVGSAGVVLRRADDGTWTALERTTDAALLTVHVLDGQVAAVGGTADAVLLEAGGAPTASALATVDLDEVPTLQGLCLEEDGGGWATGFYGTVLRREGGAWRQENTGVQFTAESLHAVWVDPDGGVWTVGGNVVSARLDAGVLLYRGPALATYVPEGGGGGGVEPDPVCPAEQIDPRPDASMARRWNESLLNAIRRAVPRPTVHARNLYHSSVAMWDAWAAFDERALGVVYTDDYEVSGDLEAARDEAIAYAAYRVLMHRYQGEVGGPVSQECFRALMDELGYDPDDLATTGDSPRALGNRIGEAVIAAFADDGANEANNYADDTGYEFVNPPLVVDQPGTGALVDPSAFQPLNLAVSVTQNGIVSEAGVQPYISPNWRNVTPFAMERPEADAAYFDATPYPAFGDAEMADFALEMIATQALLDPRNGETIDISPGAYGNNPLGTNDGTGTPTNPVTGEPYAPNVVPYGDFARVLAEFWADGPRSETPPGHWNTLANTVSDSPGFERRLFGEGEILEPLEWDVKVYLALNGAVHDAAIAAWELKRLSNSSRPITIVRHMAELGQRTDRSLPNFHAQGLPLEPGLIEVITEESSAPGERHDHLAAYVGDIAVLGWLGEPGDRANEIGGVDWIRALDWTPYQRRNFVTPAFPGFVSGHSTFSRAAAEVLTELTGSPYFPGGMGEFVARANAYLVFEEGPSVDVRLQWATYYDAADQAGQSRIYGGIHINPDDFGGRTIGSEVGLAAVERARTFYGAAEEE